VTGPLGVTACCGWRSRAVLSRAWRVSGRGRPADWSMTTRRRRPWAPCERGRNGLFGPSAIAVSVEAFERRIDGDGCPQRPGEGTAGGCALEARQA